MPTEFLEIIRESFYDELADMQFYSNLANAAPNTEVRQIIMTIVGDEYGHARVFASILGLVPPPLGPIPATAPTLVDFKQGLEAAIQGEIGAVARYSLLARLAPTQLLRLIMLNVAGDEYEHEKIWETIFTLDP